MNPVNMYALRESLCGKNKLPKDFEGTFTNQTLRDLFGNVLYDNATVVVTKQMGSGSRRPHRIFVTCPDCGRQIPAGRLAQHHKKHGNLNKVFNVIG